MYYFFQDEQGFSYLQLLVTLNYSNQKPVIASRTFENTIAVAIVLTWFIIFLCY